MTERRTSLSTVPEPAAGPSRPRKLSLTSAAMAAAAVTGSSSWKSSFNSLDAPAAVSSRKPSLTSAAMAAALAANGLTPASPRPAPSRKPNATDRKTSLATVGMAAIAVGAAPTRTPSSSSSPSRSTTASKKQTQPQPLVAMKATRRSFSSVAVDAHRIEIFFHVPTHNELQRLRVLRTLTLIGLQALVQREFNVSFEDQRIYWHGDLLEGDEDLAFYDIHDQSVLNVRVRKRYRPIGDVFTKIKTVQFRTSHAHANAKADDYDIVEVVAPLPSAKVVFQRLVTIITYLQRLDVLQAQRTQRRVWKQHVSFWEEPVAAVATSTHRRRSSLKPLMSMRQKTSRSSSLESASDAVEIPVAPAFVKLHSGPERVSYVVSLAQTHAIAQRLQLAADQRTINDLRHIKKWLASIKFFASATLPDAAMHEIARACTFVRFGAGDFIFRQGDIGDHFYIVISGCVSLAAFGNGFFATMTPGQCFGEISLQTGNGGLRTASATVNFASPVAELALLSGDIYRRVINPYKKAVLQTTEKAIYSIPQLHSLPDHIVTHIAYASKKLEAKHGRVLIRRGEDLNVLVLLIKGKVKVSAASTTPFPVVSVVRAPAVFCQESVLTNTPSTAPWDIEVLDACTLLCLRVDTISIFLAPRPDIIRALNREHTHRLQEFERRFAPYAPAPQPTAPVDESALGIVRPSSHRRSGAKISKKASYMRLLTSRLFESQRNLLTDSEQRARARRGAAAYVEFPKILLRHAPDTSDQRDEDLDRERARRPDPKAKPPVTSLTPTSPTCAELQDEFLHRALPFGEILELRQQIQFCSFAAQELEEQDLCGRTHALLRGLRHQPVEEVEMMPSSDADGIHFRFIPRPPTSPSSNVAPIAVHRPLHTR